MDSARPGVRLSPARNNVTPAYVTTSRTSHRSAPSGREVTSQTAAATRGADVKKETALVKEAEAACKAGKADMASEKAKAAMSLLKK